MKKLIIISLILCIVILSITLFFVTQTKDVPIIPINPKKPKIEKYGLLVDNYKIITDTVKTGELLGSILNKFGINATQIDKISKQSSDTFRTTFINVGQAYSIFYDTLIDNVPQTKYFVYENSRTKYTKYNFTNKDTIIIERFTKKIDTIENIASGKIESSLWNALVNNGYSWNIAIALSQTFAWTVDFYALQKDDWFKVVYDDLVVDGQTIDSPIIRAGVFYHGGRELWSVPFQQNDSSGISFYDTLGNSMRKTFLKAPLQYTRVSSRYSTARMHPIFNRPSEHRAVDFAAPCGTPIYAASDGTITRRGWDTGGGNFVSIRHNSVYSTVYMHMSSFGNFNIGQYVLQGEIIGYVGSTGWSTGCHLHYEVHENGQKIDPLSFDPPPAEPIDSVNMPRFNVEKQVWIKKIKKIKIPRQKKQIMVQNNEN
ncbi:MAG: peptidoglycan DD-metalloendopeptidase family protein [Bacteroidales bacterium]|jgi:murein DD-endopeptidase MepM/ murein hydrolase activator NlpD|nr:peptidoglycan DD-metalloendopeptidase family protein [Bacteroidales bacterium]